MLRRLMLLSNGREEEPPYRYGKLPSPAAAASVHPASHLLGSSAEGQEQSGHSVKVGRRKRCRGSTSYYREVLVLLWGIVLLVFAWYNAIGYFYVGLVVLALRGVVHRKGW